MFFRKTFLIELIKAKLCQGKHPREFIKSFSSSEPPIQLSPVSDTFEQIKDKQLFSTTPITDKRFINKSRFNMLLMLRPFSRTKAKLNYYYIAKKYVDYEEEKERAKSKLPPKKADEDGMVIRGPHMNFLKYYHPKRNT